MTDIEHIAYHESSHATAYCVLGLPVASASIELDGEGHPGHTEFVQRVSHHDQKHRRWRHEAEVIGTIAGAIGERMFTGEPGAGGGEDERALEKLLKQVSASQAVREAYRRYCEAAAAHLLDRNWHIVRRLAVELVAHGTLTGPQIEKTIRAADFYRVA
jgi:hypothetical protein